MEWQDDGIVLSVRAHGESSAIVDLLTCHHGRHAGLVRGGASKRLRGVLQPGNEVHAVWRARLEDHLGSYRIDPGRARIGDILDDGARLAGLNAACALAVALLPEREPQQSVHTATIVLLDALCARDDDAQLIWPNVFLQWELGILKELGFGLDLSACAATGEIDNLIYVSPKSGRAVSRDAGEPFREKLLPLPAFLLNAEIPQDWADLARGFDLTAFFLERYLEGHGGKDLPDARRRLPEQLKKQFNLSNGSRK